VSNTTTPDRKGSVEKGREIIATLLRDIIEHSHLRPWCLSTRSSYLPEADERKIEEVENLIKTVRFCFTRMAMDIPNDEEFAQTLTYFRDTCKVDLVDLIEDQPGKHFVELRLGPALGTMYIYYSERQLGR
jgi:hypothetical protein